MQTAAEADKYRAAGIRTVCVYGGASRMQQMNALREGADCVVATPGRCNDLISDGALDLSDVKYLVLDEADRMYVARLRHLARILVLTSLLTGWIWGSSRRSGR